MSDITPELPSSEELPADSMPVESASVIDSPEPEEEEPSRTIDPALVFIIVLAVMLLGLGALAPDVRYTIVWTILGVVSIITIFTDRIDIASTRPTTRDLAVGVVFGALVGGPLLGIGGAQLKQLSTNLFGTASNVAVFQMMAFTMPLVETLFFRGAMQAGRGLIFTGAAGGLWMILLFFPYMKIGELLGVAIVIGVCFVLINFLYSYLRERFGIFTSWTCQITINLLLLFASRLIR